MRRHQFVVFSVALLFVSLSVNCQEHDHGSAPAAASADAPGGSAAHQGQTINFVSSPGKGSGYLAVPSTKGKHPAIVVIQEWWGVDDWIKEQADRLAAAGYVALAPDLYRGQVAHDANLAHELMRGLPDDRAMNDLKGAVNELATRRDVDPKKIAVIGWCMGGGWALQLAIKDPRLAAAVINYGHLATDPAAVANIRPAIMGNFGALDRGIPPADVKTFETTLKQTGHDVDIKIYDGAGHAFMNPNNKEGYVPAAAADAQARIDAFLAKHLGR
jgi:carboxymethylenebutenolidase